MNIQQSLHKGDRCPGGSWLKQTNVTFLIQVKYRGEQQIQAFATFNTFNMISSFPHLQMEKLQIKHSRKSVHRLVANAW